MFPTKRKRVTDDKAFTNETFHAKDLLGGTRSLKTFQTPQKEECPQALETVAQPLQSSVPSLEPSFVKKRTLSLKTTILEPLQPNDYCSYIPFQEDSYQDSVYGSIEGWFKSCKHGTKPLLVVGPPGCGKTSTIIHFSKKANVDLEFYDDQDFEDFINANGLQNIRGPIVFDTIETLEII